jgi:hypothetical protein
VAVYLTRRAKVEVKEIEQSADAKP